jgi:glycosyltransferase involved in cell wall biosynthesis
MDQGEHGREAEALRAEADRLRDARDWAAAAASYAAYLALVPTDWPIWIQHGHCVKEAGDPAGALASYRRAEAGLPQDADLQVQIGHALKRAGDLTEARAAYGRALEFDPAGDAAWRELRELMSVPAARPAGLRLLDDLCLVLDLSDLLAWFAAARMPSGIQRVQIEVARGLLAQTVEGTEIRLAAFRPEAFAWRELPEEAFRRLAGLSRIGADPEEPVWAETLAEVAAMLDAAPDLAFLEGAWLVNLGSSWGLPGYHQAVRAARAGHGLRYAALVHDVGPVTAPEHSDAAVTTRFARWFSVLLREADLLLAVSEATRAEMRALAAAHLAGQPCAPIGLLRLDARPEPPAGGAPRGRAAALMAEPFVLFVATIESRKDHLFVLHAWLALLRRHGAAVPRLLLVGRAGFAAGPVLDLLRRAPAFAGRVLWLDDVDDATLAALTRGAGFVIYNSRHEGWGLPVTEALAAGKAVVAPALPALLEASQGLAVHVPPGSEPAFLAEVERLLFDAGHRAAMEARVAAGFRLRSWRAVAEDLLAQLGSAPPGPPPIAPAPPLGEAHQLGAGPARWPRPALAWAELLREGPGWHAPEPWGCWTRPGRALLRLPLPEGAGPLRLHLALRGPDAPRRVTLRLGRGMRRVLEVGPGERPVAALDLPEPGSAAEIVIDTVPDSGDPRGIGVVAVMACDPGDVAARLAFLERLSFVWPEPE